jgi:hypothetical protein
MPSRPEDPDPQRPLPPPVSAEESLRRLEQRLDRASEAAERLMAEAAAKAASTGNSDADVKPPPAGWQIREDGPAATTSDLDPFIAVVQAVRDLIPPELQRRLAAALRELLLAVRALIDWYLERLERQREQSVEVEDIPIL